MTSRRTSTPRRQSIQLASIHPLATGREDGASLEFPRYLNPADEPAHRWERHCVGTVKSYADYLLSMSNEWRSEFLTMKNDQAKVHEMMEQAAVSLKDTGEVNEKALHDLNEKSCKRQEDLMSRMMAELQGNIREEFRNTVAELREKVSDRLQSLAMSVNSVKDELAVMRDNQERTKKAADTATQAAELVDKSVKAFGELPRQVLGLSELLEDSLGQKDNLFKISKCGKQVAQLCDLFEEEKINESLRRVTSDCTKFKGTVSSAEELLSIVIEASAAVRPLVRNQDVHGLPAMISELSKEGFRLHEALKSSDLIESVTECRKSCRQLLNEAKIEEIPRITKEFVDQSKTTMSIFNSLGQHLEAMQALPKQIKQVAGDMQLLQTTLRGDFGDGLIDVAAECRTACKLLAASKTQDIIKTTERSLEEYEKVHQKLSPLTDSDGALLDQVRESMQIIGRFDTYKVTQCFKFLDNFQRQVETMPKADYVKDSLKDLESMVLSLKQSLGDVKSWAGWRSLPDDMAKLPERVANESVDKLKTMGVPLLEDSFKEVGNKAKDATGRIEELLAKADIESQLQKFNKQIEEAVEKTLRNVFLQKIAVVRNLGIGTVTTGAATLIGAILTFLQTS